MPSGSPRHSRFSHRGWSLVAIALLASLTPLARAPAPAGAGVASLQQRIAVARQDARRMAAGLEARGIALAAAAGRAEDALARERELTARLAAGQARAAELRRDVAAAARRLDRAEARLRRARRVLAGRLVAIYKSGAPDLTTVLLRADGFDDLLTRVRYWSSINRSDTRLAERVRGIREQVAANLAVLRVSRAEIESLNRRIGADRARVATLRARAQAELATVARARAAQGVSLVALRGRISGWTSEVQRLERIARQRARQWVGGWIGDFSIPAAIVMCESGGNYRALNPSSGAGGAYQLTPGTYRGLGGRYRSPNRAPKWEQDRLAAKLWAGGRGRGNWAC